MAEVKSIKMLFIVNDLFVYLNTLSLISSLTNFDSPEMNVLSLYRAGGEDYGAI